MMKLTDLHWAAGFLEGEGCFTVSHDGKGHFYPNILAVQKDGEIVERLQQLFGGTIRNQWHRNFPYKKWTLFSHRAVGLMMTLYVIMSERRQTRIEQCLHSWRTQTPLAPMKEC